MADLIYTEHSGYDDNRPNHTANIPSMYRSQDDLSSSHHSYHNHNYSTIPSNHMNDHRQDPRHRTYNPSSPPISHHHNDDIYRPPSLTNSQGSQHDSGGSGPHDSHPVKRKLFEVDHLTTFIASGSGASGLMTVEEGLNNLRTMEMQLGVLALRCHLLINDHDIIIIDNQNGEEYDCFPLELIHKPTHVIRNDPREAYNNILAFTVLGDPQRGDPDPNMHLFQCISASPQKVVEEINLAKNRISSNSGHDIPPPPCIPAPEPPGHPHPGEQNRNVQKYIDASLPDPPLSPNMYNRNRPVVDNRQDGDQESFQNQMIDLDMRKLNACCDDIERFVARLQQAADAFRALEKRKERRKKDSKNFSKKHMGDGVLTMRSKPPPVADYTDILQKFKYAFNVLARLKPFIHDPNAPELVHFLFRPLRLINDACRNNKNVGSSLANRVIAPLLSQGAKDLLTNCLSSREQDLWMSLGESWYLTKLQYPGYVPPYSPRFYGGWQPSITDVDNESHTHTVHPVHSATIHHNYHSEPVIDGHEPASMNHYGTGLHSATMHRTGDPSSLSLMPSQREINGRQNRQEANNSFSRELINRGSRIIYAEYRRLNKNNKELQVEAGDVLEVLDNSRNWWRLRNCYGEIGYAPYTILKEIPPPGTDTSDLLSAMSTLSTKDYLSSIKNSSQPMYHHSQPSQEPNENGAVYAVVGKRKDGRRLSESSSYSSGSQRTNERVLSSPHSSDSSDREILSLHRGNELKSTDLELENGDTSRRKSVDCLVALRPVSKQVKLLNEISNETPSRISNVSCQQDHKTLCANQSVTFESSSPMTKNFNLKSVENRKPLSENRVQPIFDLLHKGKIDNPEGPLKSRKKVLLKANNPQQMGKPRSASLDNCETGKTQINSNEADSQLASLHDELKARMRDPSSKTQRPRSSSKNTIEILESSPKEVVHEWLVSKGFSDKCVNVIGTLNGADFFKLQRNHLETIIGNDEISRLESQLNVLKSKAGIADRSSSELNEVLERRKVKVEESDSSSICSDTDGSQTVVELIQSDSDDVSDVVNIRNTPIPPPQVSSVIPQLPGNVHHRPRKNSNI